MNRHLPYRLAGALLAIAIGAGAAAAQGTQDQAGGIPGEWLARYSSARSLGFGSANVAIADDPLGVMWNPAGLSFMNQDELRFENAQLFGETSLNSLGFAVPGSRWPSFGVSMVSLSSGDFERTLYPWESAALYREASERVRGFPLPSTYDDINQLFGGAYGSVLDGTAAPREAIAKALPQMNQLLAQKA